MSDRETIVAQATALGQAGVAIVRLSGNKSWEIAKKLLNRKQEKIKTRHAYYGKCQDRKGNLLDECVFIFFENPTSFTGEDVVEIQCHGSPVVINSIINECCFFGARLARPGEFSERAFINEKMDLVQVEAVADLISAQSETAAKNALASLQGVFSQKIKTLNEFIIETRCYLEAAIDFPDEEGVDFISEGKIKEKLQKLIEQLKELMKSANQGVVFQEGISIVLAGEPNSGKSSLLNQLTKRDSAIVTDIAGTTRDVLKENIHINSIPINIVDTAGIRKSDDAVEKEGIKRALREIENADFVFYVIDSQNEQDFFNEEGWKTLLNYQDPEHLYKKAIVIANKIDLSKQKPDLEKTEINDIAIDMVFISAKHGDGLELLENLVSEKLGVHNREEGLFAARRRHIAALEKAKEHLDEAAETLNTQTGHELVAEDLRLAHQSLAEITGEFSSDDLLGTIFSSFCIGK